ncbi:MAG: glycogen debranching N-terminal domain-containing protein, partial [Candidatus Binatia bacterium]
LVPVALSFSVEYGADFSDLFEVRGVKRDTRGRYLEETREGNRICLAYEGLDGLVRRTTLGFSPLPKSFASGRATFTQDLRPKEEKEFFLTYACEAGKGGAAGLSYFAARNRAEEDLKKAQAQDCQIRTSNESFNGWLGRSLSDLHMMFTETGHGLYPYAGVPWFSAPFGRDGIITALEYLWVNPEVAKGVLRYLSITQAQENDPEKDAEPGKILHEARRGEMASLGEIPFDRYYGSVDATPLFVILAGAYLDATDDLAFIRSIWRHIDLALRWIDEYGDRDGDGFVEYERRSSKGLLHQGWKDSGDAVFHEDGSPAHGPIALCEVQGYVYAAKIAGAALASALGDKQRSAALVRQAEILRENFQNSFWCDEIGTY